VRGVVLSVCPFVAALFVSDPGCGQGKPAADSLPELGKIARAYKIGVVTADPGFPVQTRHGPIDGKTAEKKAIEDYTGLFAPEFGLYPPDLIKRARLRRVVLCADLSFAGQRRTAVPDWEHDTLYLDVSRGAHAKAYVRKVLHHEFFHMVDYRDDGSVYKDERWAALNPGTFKYGDGGKKAQDQNDTSVLTDKYPGFLNHYSTTGVEEDKAELFAHLIVDAAHVEDRAKKDVVLKAKVERMKELTARFCPDMNAKFWDRARKLKRADK
jgi:hypothetical protein